MVLALGRGVRRDAALPPVKASQDGLPRHVVLPWRVPQMEAIRQQQQACPPGRGVRRELQGQAACVKVVSLRAWQGDVTAVALLARGPDSYSGRGGPLRPLSLTPLVGASSASRRPVARTLSSCLVPPRPPCVTKKQKHERCQYQRSVSRHCLPKIL